MTMTLVPRRAAVLVVTALTLVCFAANSLLCRAALATGHVDAATFTGIRIVSGALVLAAIIAGRGGRVLGGSWGASLSLFAYATAFSFAYVRIHAGTGALLLFGAVQATMIGWGILHGTRPALRQWGGIVLATAGLAYLVAPGVGRPDPVGAVSMVAAGASWGCYSMLARHAASEPIAANAGNFVRCVPLALALLVATSSRSVTGAGVALAIASGAVASALGYCLWYAVLPQLGPTRAAVVQLAVPVIAAAGAVLFLGEVVTARLLASGVAVLGGIALVVASPALRRGWRGGARRVTPPPGDPVIR